MCLIVEELTGVRSDRAERGNDLIRRVELASPERDSMSRTRSFSVSPAGIVNALLTLRARRIN